MEKERPDLALFLGENPISVIVIKEQRVAIKLILYDLYIF